VPEGPRLEAGAASALGSDDRWRVRLSFAAALDNDGSHVSREGVDTSGRTVSAPLHEHAVRMDAWRTVLDLEYLAFDDLALRLKSPFELRDRRASVNEIAPATAAQRADMQRALDVHHSDATLEGARDFELSAAHWWRGAFLADDRLELAYGVSLPTGATEHDPYRRDADGDLLPHEHVQFGSGTFDPLLQLTWAAPLDAHWAVGGYAAARFPLYENRKDYRAPRELTLAASASRALSARWHLRGVATALWSGKAEWDGAPDVNSGWLAWYAGGGAEYRGARWTASLQILLPVAQRTLGDGGETFDLGPVVTLALLLPL
jgi:hypothetical protein